MRCRTMIGGSLTTRAKGRLHIRVIDFGVPGHETRAFVTVARDELELAGSVVPFNPVSLPKPPKFPTVNAIPALPAFP